MKGGKDTAMIILGKGKKHSDDDMEDMEYEDEEEMEEYSDEQYEMADELISAVKKGDSEAVLDATDSAYPDWIAHSVAVISSPCSTNNKQNLICFGVSLSLNVSMFILPL